MNAESRQSIHTDHLIVRRFRTADADDLYEYLSDPQTYVYEPGEPISKELAGATAAEMAASPDFWAIEIAATGKQIGQIYLKQVEPLELLTCELGYILNPHFQRMGYASEAAAALVEHAFTVRGMHRICAHGNPDNVASWRLLERIGFRREGLLRQNIFFRCSAAGEPLWIDTFVYAKLADEEIITVII